MEKPTALTGVRSRFRKEYLGNYQLYLMLLLPLAHFILFKYFPMFGNILAFRRFRPWPGSR